MLDMCKELFLLRHGESEWNAAGRHQGQLESRLTQAGQAQARAMGQVLVHALKGRGLDPAAMPLRTSPLIRARQTAEIALAPFGLRADPDDRLKEVHLGAWQALTDPEIFARFPWAEAPRRNDPFMWNFMSPGGENLPMLSARISALLDDLGEGPAILIAHGIALRVLRGLVLGLDAPGMRDLPGGQGVVWHIRGGVEAVLTTPEANAAAKASAKNTRPGPTTA
ncbi:MAG TPA: histidine phosphatase family protein [Rhodobacterales bacterium]|nr:histidine phosphatase family protein [Rhodobacterales bacterium]